VVYYNILFTGKVENILSELRYIAINFKRNSNLAMSKTTRYRINEPPLTFRELRFEEYKIVTQELEDLALKRWGQELETANIFYPLLKTKIRLCDKNRITPLLKWSSSDYVLLTKCNLRRSK
jgi:hypothetical protein